MNPQVKLHYQGEFILLDMYVSKWYSVRDKMFYKDIYIIQKGV